MVEPGNHDQAGPVEEYEEGDETIMKYASPDGRVTTFRVKDETKGYREPQLSARVAAIDAELRRETKRVAKEHFEEWQRRGSKLTFIDRMGQGVLPIMLLEYCRLCVDAGVTESPAALANEAYGVWRGHRSSRAGINKRW